MMCDPRAQDRPAAAGSTRAPACACARCAIEALETLAHDQLPRVRAILAEALKSADVRTMSSRLLRRTRGSIVAALILEYSPLLS